MTTEDLKQMNSLSVLGNLDPSNLETELHFADGRSIRVPTALFQHESHQEPMPETLLSNKDAILIPLIEEQLQVEKRTVVTGKVRLQKSAESYEVTINEPLAVNTWKVERIVKNETVAQAPLPRQEGATMIYPRVEERLVITKELRLVEEIRVTQEISERHDPQTVTLRRENLSVERQSSNQF